MQAATAVGAATILIFVAEMWWCTAGAEDAIKPGKWEFWIVGSKMPEPPPGMQLPPSLRSGPEGMINNLCISETNPPRTRTSVPVDQKGSCDFETTIDASAATVSWSMSCAWSSGSESNAVGIAHFHRDIFDGTTTMRHSFPNLPTQEYSSAIVGRYVGPCEPK